MIRRWVFNITASYRLTGAQLNPRVHIVDFRNAHINQYVFCADNPVNFRDPSGLDPDDDNEDGDKYVNDYIRDLRRQWYLIFNPEQLKQFARNDGRDVRFTQKDKLFEFRGVRDIRADQMGNRGPAYALSEVYGPLMSAYICVAAEVSFRREGGTYSLSDGIGSFTDNAKGIGGWIADNPMVLVLPVLHGWHTLSENVAEQIYFTPLD